MPPSHVGGNFQGSLEAQDDQHASYFCLDLFFNYTEINSIHEVNKCKHVSVVTTTLFTLTNYYWCVLTKLSCVGYCLFFSVVFKWADR